LFGNRRHSGYLTKSPRHLQSSKGQELRYFSVGNGLILV
jgi:hypothetical protein